MKKIIFIGGGFLALLLVTALVLPFVIDFNRFKPQIQAAVSESVNAEIDFESARLTILTGLGVKLTKVSVKNTAPDFKGIEFFQVDELMLRANLAPLFSGMFEGELRINKPQIIFANKGVRNNLASLTKPAKGTEAAVAETPEKEKTPQEKAEIEKKVEEFKSRVSIKAVAITDAVFKMQNIGTQGTKEVIKISDLDILVENIGLERDVKTTISTDVKFDDAGVLVNGPVKVNMLLKASTEGTQFKIANFKGKLSFDDLDINAMKAFLKPKGIALNLDFNGNVTPDSFTLEKLNLNFHKTVLQTHASIKGFKDLNTVFGATIKNDDLQSLGDLLPQHKTMLVGGKIDLALNAKGLLSDISKLKADADLKAQLTGADIALKLDVFNALAPHLNLKVASQKLDLDALLGPFLPKKDSAVASAPAPTQGAEANKAPSTDSKESTQPAVDFALTAEQKNLLKNADIAADISLKEIKFDKINIKNFAINFVQKGLMANLNNFSLDIFEGKIGANGKVNLAHNPVAYDLGLKMAAVETAAIIGFVTEEHKDVLSGKANFDMTVNGNGTTVPTLSKTLNAKGSYLFLDGKVKGASVANKANEALNGFIGGLGINSVAGDAFAAAEKLLSNDLLKKAGVDQKFNLAQYKQKYDSFSKVSVSNVLDKEQSLKDSKGSLEIKQGRLYITSDKSSNSGNFNLNSSVGLDMTLDGKGVFTASEVLKANMNKSSQYSNLLYDDKNQLAFAFVMGGTVMEPTIKPDFSAIKNAFTKNANALVKKELDAEIERLKKELIGNKLEDAKKKLKEQLDAKKAEFEKKKAEEKAKLDAKKKEQEDAAKKKLDEEKKKNQDKLKDKLKGKIPGL